MRRRRSGRRFLGMARAGGLFDLRHPLRGQTIRTPEKEQAILDALRLHPSKTRACRSARVGRQSFYDWLNADPNFKKRVEAAQEIGIDAVEDALFKGAMDKDDTTAQIFTLKSFRRERYGDRQAVDMNVNGSLTVTIGERPDGPE